MPCIESTYIKHACEPHTHMDSYIVKGRTQCRELPLCAGSGKGCQWQALPSPVQCEETATRTRDLPVTGSKTLPLAPGPPFDSYIVQEQKGNFK